MSISLADFIILASVLQGLFVGVAILATPFFRSEANFYLGLSTLLLSGITFLGWQDFNNIYIDFLWSVMWEFLIPVILFFYFLHAMRHPFLKAKWLTWLYIPFFLLLTIDLIIGLDFVFGYYKLPFSEDHPAYQAFDSLEDTTALCYNIFLIGWAYLLVDKNTQAAVERKRWLKRICLAFITVLGVWLFSYIIETTTEIEHPFSAIWLAISFLFWWVCYYGVYNLRILDDKLELRLLLDQKTTPTFKPVNRTGSKNKNYPFLLKRLMANEQLYRNPDLSRQIVASRLGISEGYLSQVINTQLGESFVDFINSFRIASAKEMLSDPNFDTYSLEAIGTEAGFRSRSAFYNCFKKVTNKTPGAYRNSFKRPNS